MMNTSQLFKLLKSAGFIYPRINEYDDRNEYTLSSLVRILRDDEYYLIVVRQMYRFPDDVHDDVKLFAKERVLREFIKQCYLVEHCYKISDIVDAEDNPLNYKDEDQRSESDRLSELIKSGNF